MPDDIDENSDDFRPNFNMPPASADGGNLKALIKQLIKERQYEGVALLFTSANEAAKNVALLPEISIDLFNDVCKVYFTEQVYQEDAELFTCVEELLKTIAAHGPPEELLMELIELMDDPDCMYECTFTSTLRAIQIILLRIGNKKSMAMEWSLDSIWTRMAFIHDPEYLHIGYDEEEKRLLEQDEDVQNILMHHITLGLFYEPLVKEICSHPRKETEIFRNCRVGNRRNIMTCFLIQMLGAPLGLLDLSKSENKKTNTYTIQCASSHALAATKCLVDPYFLLSFVETRVRWKKPVQKDEEDRCLNIFLLDLNLPLDSLAIYYYMVIVEGIGAEQIPQVYNPLYVCEAGIYLAQELLASKKPAFQEKALRLVEKLVSNLGHTQLQSSALDLPIHRSFLANLCHLIGYSSHKHLRQHGVQLLRQYILAYDDEGKYLILKNLMSIVQHHGICGYLASIYKDLVAKALMTSTALPPNFTGDDFRSIFLQNICKLPQGVETDLIENSDKIISSLNAVRYFALKDNENLTGFWSFAKDIEAQYLVPLRKALDLSEAHYKAELKNVREGRDLDNMEHLKLLDINIENDKADGKGGGFDFQLDRGRKIELLNQNLCTFDLIRSLLGRVSECLDNNAPKKDSSEEQQTYANLSHFACRSLVSSPNTVKSQQQQHHSQTQQHQQQQQQHGNSKIEHSTKHSTRNTFKLTDSRINPNHRTFCTKSTTSLDEFRAKEEKREEEYEQQEKTKKQEAENEKNAKVEAIRVKILEAALQHVPTLGWTRKAIVQGAEEAGYPSVVHGMFPEGGFDLVSYFNGKCNEELLKILQNETDNGTKEITNPLEFLVRFVRLRLEMIVPHKSQWPQALALIALPQNASTALAQVLTLVDDICYYSGDRSVDVGWYTRRIGLATIMKMTELYMLQDNSPDHSKTWEFLQNRMDEAVQLQSILMQTEGVTSKFQKSFNSAFITARNILGLNYNRS